MKGDFRDLPNEDRLEGLQIIFLNVWLKNIQGDI
jgi:hypothetical protein